ncbi:MAG: hypothetical protein E7267_00040 [Lachnospiraceae bacterium]|nr:hypothetical protein [Lachnospiraceae bacterium]
MTINKNNIVIEKGNVFPLGISTCDCGVLFSYACDEDKSCKLHLINIRNEQSIVIDLGEEYRTGNVRSCVISSGDAKHDIKTVLQNDYGYVYEVDGKFLCDPYAAKIYGREKYGSVSDKPCAGFYFDDYDWEDDKSPDIKYEDMILYRMHVRGFTMDTSSGVKNRGTYEGITEKADYLKELGVNAVLLMPAYDYNEIMKINDAYGIPAYAKETAEDDFCKLNYWGYTDDAAYFAPKASFSANPHDCNTSFKNMIKKLHQNGIEVIMDIHFGMDTDCYLMIDCLRSWAYEYHVDGFKINNNAFPEALVKRDRVLENKKFITSYWDRNGYFTVGKFADYNDGSMINIRKFILSYENQVSEYAERFVSDSNKVADIRYISDMNTFTLMDMVSYDKKHNEANGENNQDGTDYNYSSGYGCEGPTRKKKINEERMCQMKNAVTLLFMSYGTPMLLSGDEFGNSSGGNNNAYCQDNKTSYVDWKAYDKNTELFDYIKELIAIRKYSFSHDSEISFHGVLPWKADYSPYSKSLGVLLSKKGVYIAINMDTEDKVFALPSAESKNKWKERLCTRGNPEVKCENGLYSCSVPKKSIVIFVSTRN